MTAPADRPGRRRPESRVVIVALILPIAIVAVSLGVVLAWLPQLPSTAATHWGPGGQADGFGPRIVLPVLLAAVGLGLPGILGGLVVGTTRSSASGLGFGQKLLAVTSLGVALLVSVVFLSAVGSQRGLTSAEAAPTILPFMLLAFGLGIASAVVAWFVLPPVTRAAEKLQPVDALRLAAGERAVWLGTARFPAWTIALILIPTLVIAAIAGWAAADRGGPGWLLLLIPVAMLLAVLSSVEWRVRVDAAGLRVRSMLGLPRWRIPVADIAAAGTTTVAGLAEFGGWGLRFAGHGRIGVITRSGPALEVRRRDGSSLVITVDDAASAAALLTAEAAGALPS